VTTVTGTGPDPGEAKASRASVPRKRGATRGSKEILREPNDPFARWFGRVVVGIWAVGAQSFADPWNRFGAFLSPGVGYILGHGLQRVVYWKDDRLSRRKEHIVLIEDQINQLMKEVNDARNNGMEGETIAVIQRQFMFTLNIEWKLCRVQSVSGLRSLNDNSKNAR